MKNLLNYGVQEMNAEEKISTIGGWNTTTYTDNGNGTWTKKVKSWRWENGVKVNYKTVTSVVNSNPLNTQL